MPDLCVRWARAAAVVLLACGVTAQAAQPESALQQRVAELVRWIAAHSEYPAALNTPPKFVFLAPDAIRHAFSNSAMGYSRDTSDVRAAQIKGTIYLPNTFALGRDDYMLLHELVHYLQDQSGKQFECPALREREAYELQTKFVEQTGAGETPNDMFMLMLRCGIRLGEISPAGKLFFTSPLWGEVGERRRREPGEGDRIG
jgi:hypothetical protein